MDAHHDVRFGGQERKKLPSRDQAQTASILNAAKSFSAVIDEGGC